MPSTSRPRGLAALLGFLVVLAVAALAPPAHPQDNPGAPVQWKGMSTWASPSGTRLVLDFSAPVTPVSPDSGSTPQLVVAVPSPGIAPAPGTPTALAGEDTVIQQVSPIFDQAGCRFWIRLAPGTTFKVYTLAATDDTPFRVIVDVLRPGARASEDKRLEAIAVTKKKSRTRLVVIDAGHGGDDRGAIGPGGVLEKNITLQVAHRLADALNETPGVKAILTRDSDFFIPLHERYAIAEKAKADVFISIHCNSSRRRGRGSGSEVYFLSLKGATDQEDKDLADIENAADRLGGISPQAEDDVVSVLYGVKRNAMLERSQLLAEELLDHLAADRRVDSRGVKQAGFAVLKSVEFPSALVETAFINNPREVLLLKNPTFQQNMARQLASGIRSYFNRAGVTLTPDSSNSSDNGDAGR